MALVEIHNLRVRFETDEATIYAVNGIDLMVEPGQSIGIVGESGSGKSVSVTSIPRLLPRTARVEGSVYFNGKDMMRATASELQAIRGHQIGMIFQNPHAYLNPTRTIGKQLMEPLLFHHLAGVKRARAMGMEMLDRVGIVNPKARFDNYPFEFSGGMLQRVLIAMALITGPKLVIADEPTTALDVTVQAQILRLLKEMQRELGMSMIFVTHDLAVASQVSDVIYVMYGGIVVERLPAKQLIRVHRHPYLSGLLASLPRVDEPVGRLPFIPGLPVNTRQPLSGCPFYARCQWHLDQCQSAPPLTLVERDHEAACWLADERRVANGQPS
ncbi:MAG: ABC transporter ATP-binding protein [Firmicutes bacterium]|jgi:oligopeptide/dipeptide ABC transporter ATP-binding protein|nr:ABC transporter ATP-binding protein [Bacillota bacterium]